MTRSGLSRAGFIRRSGALGAGLALAFTVPEIALRAAASSHDEFKPNAWLRIAPDDTVTVILAKSEMGQGVATGLPTLVADELDASLDKLRIEIAPTAAPYGDPEQGNALVTGGSNSLEDSWIPLRTAGATARSMLVAAAAKQWGVDPSACSTRAGTVYHDASGRHATYGSLVALAATLPVPTNVALKSPDRFTLIGKHGPRLDAPSKVNGKAQYGIDVRIPGMMYAAIARAPVFGGRVKHFDATKAKAVPGVTHVVEVSNGVAVVAKNTYAAFAGRAALQIAWDDGENAHLGTPELFAHAEELARTRRNERVALTKGTPENVAGQVFKATYRGPLLAHATMEPMNATAHVHDGVCEVWAPTQVQTRCQQEAAQAAGVPREKVTLHTTLLGGGFGRRLESDYVREAVEVSKAAGVPVKVQWSREDDTQHDFYRPMSVNTVRAVLADGKLVALEHQVVQPSQLRRWFPGAFQHGIDGSSMTGVVDTPYLIPNLRYTYVDTENGIPVGAWRAPTANWNSFVTETFLDELAHAAGIDPVAFRLAMLPENGREAGVLRLVAEKAGWGKPQPRGVAQGLAYISWAKSYGAMVAEVSMRAERPKVHRVVVAVDCGTAVNPDIVAQQAEGATIFGLSAAMTGKITVKKGRVQQANFDDYTILRIADAPRVDVHIVPNNEAPTGIGELCTPLIAPAVANAVFILTRKRVRSLPFCEALT